MTPEVARIEVPFALLCFWTMSLLIYSLTTLRSLVNGGCFKYLFGFRVAE